ncbi:MAG: DUF5985 family protein [Bdellovibrionota bacterium]
MYQFLSGAIMLACLTAGYFFFRFYRKTTDSFFLWFANAFWMLALERAVLGWVGREQEPQPEIYLIRLTAFLLILMAIIRKNRNA